MLLVFHKYLIINILMFLYFKNRINLPCIFSVPNDTITQGFLRLLCCIEQTQREAKSST